MSKNWIESVRSTKQLTVFDGIQGGKWTGVFAKGLQEFNKLAKSHKFGVSMVAAKTAKDANVVVQLGKQGKAEFTYDRTDYSLGFNESRMHGLTRLLSRTDDPDVEKVYTFLPSDPKVLTPQHGTRPVGSPVRIHILVHELIHACGLEDGDHGKDGIFHGNPVPDPGSKPHQDRVYIIKKISKTKLNHTFMPPIIIDAETAAAVRKLWK